MKADNKKIREYVHRIKGDKSKVKRLPTERESYVYSIEDRLIYKIMPESLNRSTYQEINRLLEDSGVPFPNLIDEWKEGGFHHLIQEKKSGKKLSAMNNKEKVKYYPEVASILYKIHMIKINSVGPIEEAGGKFSNWASYIRNFKKFSENHGDVVPEYVTKDDYEIILRAVEDLARRKNNPCLVHGDFMEKNILVEGGKVTAILDWDVAIAGDRIMDFATFRLWDGIFINNSLIEEYYPEKKLFEQDKFEFYCNRYQLYSGFITLDFLISNEEQDLFNLPEKINRICSKIQKR